MLSTVTLALAGRERVANHGRPVAVAGDGRAASVVVVAGDFQVAQTNGAVVTENQRVPSGQNIGSTDGQCGAAAAEPIESSRKASSAPE